MKKDYILEIAAFNLQAALLAAKAGAHRIELCDNAAEGGTTPSYGTLSVAKLTIDIPVFPIIRPRGGNFVYSEAEFHCIKEDIGICRSLGYEGIVTGLLDKDGHIEIKKLKTLVKQAAPMQVTFHRAFDRTADPLRSMEAIIDAGCTRILSSGHYPSVLDGIDNVSKLIESAKGRIIIMPGSGLNSGNVREIATRTGATEFHTAARKLQYDENVRSPETMDEKPVYTTVDQDEVKKICKALYGL